MTTIDEQLDTMQAEIDSLRAQVAEGQLAGALTAAQAALGPVRKNKRNPHYRSTYADLAAVCEAIREPATAAGLSWSHTTRQAGDGWIVIETTITHESGATRTHTFPARPTKSDPQSIAGIVSYGMRYGLIMAFGLATSDDADGQPRTTAAHHCRACRQPLHSAMMCEKVWEPIEFGELGCPVQSTMD